MEKKYYTLLFKSLSVVFVILSFFLNFIEIGFSGTTINPSRNFDYSLAFGLFRFPGFIFWEGVAISFNFIPIMVFQIIFTISFLLYLIDWKIIRYIKKSWMKKHHNLVYIPLMLIGIFGFVTSVELTIILREVSPTVITSSFRTSELQLGLMFAFMVVAIVVIEYILSIKFFDTKIIKQNSI